MSSSQHPIALRLERLVRDDAKLLALVMGLPLIDGIFVALILAGGLADPISAIQVGLLIFGGSATLAVILAEMDGTPREQALIVLLVGVPLIAVAALQAALAPTIGSFIDTVIFERFAALVIAAIAAKTASATIGEYLPSPGVIIGLGLIASLDPSGAEFVLMTDTELMANATLAAVVGVAFALGVALGGPYLREYMDIDRFRFGSAVALGILPLSLLGMAFGHAPLAALVVAALLAFDPGSMSGSTTTDDQATVSTGRDDPMDASQALDASVAGVDPARTDGGDGEPDLEATVDEDPDSSPYPGDDTTDTSGRAPWL